MGHVTKRGRVSSTSADAVAAGLPDRFKTYEAWHISPGGSALGLQLYRTELVEHLTGLLGRRPSDSYIAAVQEASAGPVADWYRVMLSDREETLS